MGKPQKPSLGWLLTGSLKLLFWALVILLPLLGAWIGSALAAFQNGPTWVPIACAVLAFPVLPLLWDAFGSWRAGRADKKREDKARRVEQTTGKRIDGGRQRYLTFGDRLILRTMAVNLVFLGILFAWFPQNVFTALSTRGDWFLDGSRAGWANTTRGYLFAAADQLEWLWELTHDNPFDDDTPAPDPDPKPDPSGGPTPQPRPHPAPKPSPQPSTEPDTQPSPQPEPDTPRKPPRWPFERTLHPAVTNMPSGAETSIEAVGRYLASQESDPYLLVKALHDYTADRISYDAASYVAGRYPPQDARSVFSARTGVCAGYARLMVALGEAAGVEIVYLVGQSRDMGGNVDGQGHAWNAARIEGEWHLIDATWDAGYVAGDTFTKTYNTDYLLAPPEVFGLNHFPDEERWQLREEPISRGEFMRQPNMRPSLYASGFKLLAPDRSQVTSDSAQFEVSLENTLGKSLLVSFSDKGEIGGGQRCEVSGYEAGERTHARCTLPGQGTFHVALFVGEERFGTHWYAGQFEVHRR